MQIVYGRSSGLVGVLIRAASWWDQWTHCGIVTPERTLIHATRGRGVVEDPLHEFLAEHQAHDIVKVDTPHPDVGVAFAREQLGRGYDWLSILEFVVREPLQERDRWQCVELVEAALYHAGVRRWRNRPWHRVTVQQSYMVM